MSRKGLEENASLFMACFALAIYFLFQAHDDPHVFSALLLPISAFYSARTVVRLASKYAPSVGWWLRGTLRWTSWWMLYALIAYLVLGIVAANVRLPYDLTGVLFVWALVAIPTLLLMRQVFQDYTGARHRFGSITQAEKAQYPNGRRRSRKGCRV